MQLTQGRSHLRAESFYLYFGGDPRVSTEAPVSSIDDAVTCAVLAAQLGEPNDGGSCTTTPALAPAPPATTPPPAGALDGQLPATGAARVPLLVGVAALAAREIIRVRTPGRRTQPGSTDAPVSPIERGTS